MIEVTIKTTGINLSLRFASAEDFYAANYSIRELLKGAERLEKLSIPEETYKLCLPPYSDPDEIPL